MNFVRGLLLTFATSLMEENSPSTELIADEYDVREASVHIFAESSCVANCEQFLKSFNIELSPECIHELDSYDNVCSTLDTVARTPEKKSLLFLIFWGYFTPSTYGQLILDDGKQLLFYEVWSKFCNEDWRNIPKVFLLNVIKSDNTIQRDSHHYKPREFDTPNEGDVLVILKKNDDIQESRSFFAEMEKIIKEFGMKEDFSSIVTSVEVSEEENIKSRPILISTMLKKLFLIPSPIRGHHLTLMDNKRCIFHGISRINDLFDIVLAGNGELSIVDTDNETSYEQTEKIESRRSSCQEAESSRTRKSIDQKPRNSISFKNLRRKISTSRRKCYLM